MEKSVLNKDAVSREEIRNYAKTIADEFRSEAKSQEDKRLLVLDMLGKDRMLRRLDLAEEDLGELSEEEVESALQPIRKALVEELAGHLDPEEFGLISRDIRNMHLEVGEIRQDVPTQTRDEAGEMTSSNRNRIMELLRSGSREDEVFRSSEMYDSADAETKERLAEAHALLAQAQEEEKQKTGEYFPGVARELEFDADSGESVVEKMDLKEMNDLVLTTEEERVGPKEADKLLRFFSEATDAARWLEDHGLMLEDIKLANIGLVTDKDGKERAIFHDLDGLHPIGTKDRLGMFAGEEFDPPEFGEKEREDLPATSAKEMVYQLGVSLTYTIVLKKQTFSEHIPRESYQRLLELAAKMAEPNPDDRPELAECKRQIDEIAGEIGLEGLEAAAA